MKSTKALVLSLLVCMPVGAQAASITIDVTGTATIANGVWAGQGTAVSGSYTYDSDLSPTANTSTINTFLSNNALNAGLGYNLTIELGTTVLSLDEGDTLFNFSLQDSATAATSNRYNFNATQASLQRLGTTTDAIDPLDGTVPTDVPDLSQFSSTLSAGRVGTDLKFSIDSLTMVEERDPGAAIPEPRAALVFGVGMLVVGTAVRRRSAC